MSTVKLGDVAIESRDSLKEKDKSLPVVGLEHLIPEQINLTDWNIGQENTFTKTFEKGDVLFGRRRAYLKKAAVAPCKGICSGDITVIRAKEDKILAELLPFVIQNDIFFDYAVGKSAGSLSPRVKWEHLANYEFNLPELDEQKKLAEVLWQIVDTMESYKKLLAKTDEMVKGKIQILLKETNKFKTIPEICSPKQWKTLATKDLIDDGYPVYGANGVIGYTNEYNHEFPTITITCRGATCGCINVTKPKSWINGNAMSLDNLSSQFNISFVEYYLRNIDFSIAITGSAQPQITQATLKNIKIPCINNEMQNKFADYVKKSEKSKALIHTSLNSLSAVYKKIIVENLGGSN